MEKIVLPFGNGAGVYDGQKVSVCAVDDYGEKAVGGCVMKSPSKVWQKPILRGFAYLFYGLSAYFNAYIEMKGLQQQGEQNKSFKIAGKINIASSYLAMIALALSAFIFGFVALGVLPAFLSHKILGGGASFYLTRFIIALLRVGILYGTFVILRFLPFMSGLYGFNGAGNIFLSGRKGGHYAKCNPLNFLNFLLNVFLISTFVVSLVGINVHWAVNFLLNGAVIFAIIPLCFEFLRFAGLRVGGFWGFMASLTNWLVSAKPQTTHSEVIRVAGLELENYNDFARAEKGMVPMSSVFAQMETKLRAVDRFEESDVDWIIGTILNKSRAEVKLVRFISQKEAREILRATERRAGGEPLSSIFGWVEFYGLRFDVNKKVLSPRMETEILVEEALKKIEEYSAQNVLDLCTGSGAIAVTVAKYSKAKVFASDISKQALMVASANAKKNGVKVEFCQSDLFKSLKKGRKYDIIISNPPYIKRADLEKLDVEVKKYDPRLALDGGEDGLDFYRAIITEAKTRLNKKGWLFLEVGAKQGEEVTALMQANGYENVCAVKDYNKIERVIYGRTCK